VKVAAVQLEARVGDVASNLADCERLGDRAGREGARVIALPEFFSTGIGFVPELADAALPPDGPATELLLRLATRHGALVGGSFLCRDGDGEVRNAYLLARPDGTIAGRHDKDLPTMWENAFYVGGSDDGVIDSGDGLAVGAAVCWELMRTQTVHRLRGLIDLAMTGSGWWSIPERWGPAAVTRRLEARNAERARAAAESFAAYVGAPLLHAAHAGKLRCRTPWAPLSYDGHFEGQTLICDADGTVLARREWHEGEGVVSADIEPGRRPVTRRPPDRFWLHRRGFVPALFWHLQRAHGRRWYVRNVRRRPAYVPERSGAREVEAPRTLR
jgi:predicted amidohydrolase